MKTKRSVQWVVGDLSVGANEIIAKALGQECDQNFCSFFFEGKQMYGYYVPYSMITRLRQIARRQRSGITFTVFKREGDLYKTVPFGSHQYKRKKEDLEKNIGNKIKEIKKRRREAAP